MHEAVRSAISIIRSRYNEPLTLEGLAAETFFSPFYFSRLFREHTGMPPGQYLTAMRMFEAKRLLMTTSMTVTDIVTAVGYSSVGTFTTRFTRATGMSPSQFRQPEVAKVMAAVGPGLHLIPSFEFARASRQRHLSGRSPTGSIVGDLHMHNVTALTTAEVLIGVFDSLAPAGPPMACNSVRGVRDATDVLIEDVPIGEWFVIAFAIGKTGRTEPDLLMLGTSRRPVSVVAGKRAAVSLFLHTPLPTDPPIAMALVNPRPLNLRRVGRMHGRY
jgi:AraC family transcriptional regulator